ncbi:MAG: hypothetical protein K2M37_05720, partial [Muribaculaceae bacterium]|nr:hypothetical protein [Muribaculaceae bacterium]
MASFLLYSFIFWLCCLGWFLLIQKPIFILYNLKGHGSELHENSLVGVYLHGIRSDAIVASYLSAVPLIYGAIATVIPVLPFQPVMIAYTGIVALTLGLLTAADAALYP